MSYRRGTRKSSVKQVAYARRIFGGEGKSKKEIALDVGFSPNVARSVKSHVEDKPGFNYAMMELAKDSNNLALAAMHEFKLRGFSDFSNKDLVGALNAIGAAWSRFNEPARTRTESPDTNRLRTIILQQVENQTQTVAPTTNQTVNVVPNKTIITPNDTFDF